MRWLLPMLSRALVSGLMALLGACASLPPAPPRTVSMAMPAVSGAGLAAAVAVDAPEVGRGGESGLSGLRLLPTGPMALHTRLELLRRAQHSIDLQAYHIKDDETGRYVLRLLRDAAERGVRVRLLLDDLYTAGCDELLLGLAAHPNVEVRLFNPFPAGRSSLLLRFASSLRDIGRVHRRMHNKLLIADGAVAIAGGRNLGNDYFMRRPGDNFIDLDTLVVGAVLPELAGLFDRYWNSRHAWPVQAIARTGAHAGDLRRRFDGLTGPDTTPTPERPDEVDRFGQGSIWEAIDAGRPGFVWAPARAFADSPDKVDDKTVVVELIAAPGERGGIRYQLVEHIRAAQREVLMSSPYLVPTPRSMDTIGLLGARGVRMAVLTNSLAATDEPVVHTAYRRYRRHMLDQGVELYELTPLRMARSLSMARLSDAVGRLHAKAVVIDRDILYIGSFNFDHRSAGHNTEFGLIVHSPVLAEQVASYFGTLLSEGAFRVKPAPDGQGLAWYARAADGAETLEQEPDAGWWRRLMLELLGPLVPEDLL